MNNIFNLIDEMESYFDSCKKVPITNKLMVDIEVIYEFMTDLRLKLPDEIKKAERVLDEREKIMYEATQAVTNAEREAETKVAKLVNEHEIVQKAYKEAEVVVNEAKNTAKEMKLGAYEYVDELIAQVETAIQDTLRDTNSHYAKLDEYMKKQVNLLEGNRQELQIRRNGKKR